MAASEGPFSTCIATSASRCASRTQVFAPAACLCTFVRASCTTRYAVCSTSGGYARASPSTDSSTVIPAALDSPTRVSTSCSRGPSSVAAAAAAAAA